jgi:threonine dehydrogenase-like Zn-dependent dehydrogenase
LNVCGGDKLKAALFKAPGEIVLEEVPVPEISDEQVLVEVRYCGICGSDAYGLKVPEVTPVGCFPGHEFSGVIVKVGSKVKDWKPGDRVVVCPWYMCGECFACKHGFASACRYALEKGIGIGIGRAYAGGFAKFVRIPSPQNTKLYLLPEEVSFEEGALVEPLSVSLHAIRKSIFQQGDQVMVLGSGPIGLGVIALLKNAGAGLIIATAGIHNKKRAKLAKKFGADYVFNPGEVSNLKEEVLRLTGGIGVAQVFDCSASPQAFQSARGFLRPEGQIIIVGDIEKAVPIVPLEFCLGEIQMRGVSAYGLDEYSIVIEFLKKGVLPAKELITSKIKLSNIVKEGLGLLAKPGHSEIKVLVEPDD